VEADAGARPKARPRSSHAASCPLTTRRFEPPWSTKFIIVATSSRALWRTRAGEVFGFVATRSLSISHTIHDWWHAAATNVHRLTDPIATPHVRIGLVRFFRLSIVHGDFSCACLVGSAKRILLVFKNGCGAMRPSGTKDNMADRQCAFMISAFAKRRPWRRLCRATKPTGCDDTSNRPLSPGVDFPPYGTRRA
jgi:hypothetical protein